MIQSITGLWASLAFFSSCEECKGGTKVRHTYKKRQKERNKKRKQYYCDFLDRVSNYKVFMDDPDSWN
jgi:hypothetical protein